MRPIHTDLPAPTGGMLLAKRPTGVIMAFVVLLIALILQSIPTGTKEIIAAVQAALDGVAYAEVPWQGFTREAGVIALFSFGIMSLWLWFWLAVKERRSFATLGFTNVRKGLRLATRGLLIGVGMMTVCIFVPLVAGQATLTWASPDATSWSFILIMLLGFLVQGSTEEILTRGYLTQAVARRWGLVAAVIVQSVFFMLLHGMNPGMGFLPVVNLLMFAIFGSFMSLAEGSLWGICAMHGAWNWAQGNFFGVPVSGSTIDDSYFTYAVSSESSDLITGGAFGIEGSLITTVVFLIGSVVAWKAWQKRRATEADSAPIGLVGEVQANAGAVEGATTSREA